MNGKVVLFVLGLLVISLACRTFSASSPTTSPAGISTISPTQARPAPTATPGTGMPSQGAILFQDDFSSPDSGWITTDQDLIALDYFEGGYRATVKSSYVASFSAFPKIQFTDASIEADAQFLNGPDGSLFGLLCRATAAPDLQSGYEMNISPGGAVGIVKVTGALAGQQTALTSGKSPLIHTGTATNHLRMDCSGDHIAIYVNGRQLVEVQDSDYKQGRVGFVFGANSDPGFQVLFDNFTVRQIGAGTSF